MRTGSGLLDVAEKVEAQIISKGGQPAFPTGVGVNEITAHHAPQEDEKGVIQESDVVKIDYGVHIDGYIADTAITVTENPGTSRSWRRPRRRCRRRSTSQSATGG